jgi:hypothetical protein
MEKAHHLPMKVLLLMLLLVKVLLLLVNLLPLLANLLPLLKVQPLLLMALLHPPFESNLNS